VTRVLPSAPPRAQSRPTEADRGPSWARRLVRGRPEDPAWVRPRLLGLLAGTVVLYMWGLAASGWANAFYSAAAQAGGSNWKAFFYGSFDAANSITVDKPPASLWVMDLSVRLFGLSSWSILLPQALMGVATVGVLYLTVRRVSGPGAGLLAGAILALTPVAVLIFRFNNPDALLVLLLTLAAYAVTRAVECGRGRWLVLAGVLIGFGFLAKMLQTLLVVPGFGLAYLVAAPIAVRHRVLHLLGSGLAMLVSAGWWVAIVELVPASARPYIGGSQTNSVWELIWGYNGLGRLNGNETGSVTSLPGGRWGNNGVGRLFNSSFGSQVTWLLPAALILLVAGLVVLRGTRRTDLHRASLMLWGGWLVVTWLTFSLAAGIIHPYYSVALAPAIGAVVAIGGQQLWQRRGRPWVPTLLAVILVGTGAWAWILLDRSSYYMPWLRWVVVAAAILAAVGVLRWESLGRPAVIAVLAAGVVATLGAPAIYSWQTTATPHSGALPTAGPRASVSTSATTATTTTATTNPSRQPGLGPLGAPSASGPGGLFPGLPVPSTSAMGSLLVAPRVDPQVAALLRPNGTSFTWVAATLGSENAAGFQLATGLPVLALGGFNASDPYPALADFQADVAAGRIHWFIGGGTTRPSSTGSDVAHRIAAWVVANYPEQVVDGVILYDLAPRG
jgi:4-amino-4-deoxy-L-arabinose transferase-like glycosyltransferase